MKLGTAHQNIRHWLAAAVALILQGNICPHSLQHIQDAGTSRINAHILQQQFTMRNYRSSHQPKSSRANVSRHHNFLWGNQLILSLNANSSSLIAQLNSKGFQHQLCMIAGSIWLHHSSSAIGKKPCQQNSRLYLGTGHRHIIGNPLQGLSCRHNGNRQSGIFCPAYNIGPHHGQRLNNPSHRPFVERAVPSKDRNEFLRRQHTHHQPQSSTRISCIQHCSRLL